GRGRRPARPVRLGVPGVLAGVPRLLERGPAEAERDRDVRPGRRGRGPVHHHPREVAEISARLWVRVRRTAPTLPDESPAPGTVNSAPRKTCRCTGTPSRTGK